MWLGNPLGGVNLSWVTLGEVVGSFDDINSPHSIRGRRNRTMPGEMGENGLFLLLQLQRPFA
jgi:hypothetical protein